MEKENNIYNKFCLINKDYFLQGVCLNKEYKLDKLLCIKCLIHNHSNHSEKIKDFDK